AVDSIGDSLNFCGEVVDAVVESGVVYEFAGRTIPTFDLPYEQVHSVPDLHDLRIQGVIRNQPAHCPLPCARVAHEHVGFPNHRICIFVYGFVHKKLSKSAFALFDAVRDFLEVLAEDLQVRDEIIGSLNNLADIAFFGALNESSVRYHHSFFGAARDIDFAIAQQSNGRDGNLGVGADDILVTRVDSNLCFDGFVGIGFLRYADAIHISDRHTFERDLRPIPEIIRVLEEGSDRVLRHEKAGLTADIKDGQRKKGKAGDNEYAHS